MYQSNFSLSNLFILFGSAVFAFFCFLSFNLLSSGNIETSILESAKVSILLGLFALVPAWLKRTHKPTKSKKNSEYVFLFLFAIFALYAIKPFSHYLAIYEQKISIQETLNSDVEQAINMFNNYEIYANKRIKEYKTELNHAVRTKNTDITKYDDYGFIANVSDAIQIETKEFTLEVKLYPSNYEDMKSNASTWLKDAKNSITGWEFIFWNAIGIVKVINEIDNKIKYWNEELKKLSVFQAQGEYAEDFDSSITLKDIKDKMKDLSGPTLFSTFCALILYIVMLLSYFITPRRKEPLTNKKHSVSTEDSNVFFEIDFV